MTKHALLASVFAFAAVAAPASADFGGLYLGAHAGGIWGDIETTTATAPVWFDGDNADFSASGVLAGGQVGYDFLFSNWVFGIELSGSTMDFEEVRVIDDDTYSSDLEWLGVAALRAGWVMNQRSLIYVKGGYAAGSVQTRDVDTNGVDGTGAFSTDEMHGGWMAGAGFEHQLSSEFSAALEYNYIDLGSQDHSAVSGGNIVNDVDVQTHAVTARLNWHFWSP